MKLSFVIPAYNEEGYLSACLKSVQKEITESGVDAEIIVVNNASTDKTAEVARSFKDVRVVDEPRKGLSQARQTGFAASSGELIANIDADTIVPPGWIKKVLKAFTQNGRLAALSGPYIYYDLPWYVGMMVRLFYIVGYAVYAIGYGLFGFGAMLQGGNFIVRRTSLEKAGGFDLSVSFYGEDTAVARRLANVGRVWWTFNLYMYTSGRRFKREGLATIGIRYALNYFSISASGKPVTTDYKDIRLK
ncbi:MAG: glycosyltransferase family 2 protein [Patescibacteria group bacterium]|nr:glycosyltransferase family 2 protein [Patescibacteria group bacterium]